MARKSAPKVEEVVVEESIEAPDEEVESSSTAPPTQPSIAEIGQCLDQIISQLQAMSSAAVMIVSQFPQNPLAPYLCKSLIDTITNASALKETMPRAKGKIGFGT